MSTVYVSRKERLIKTHNDVLVVQNEQKQGRIEIPLASISQLVISGTVTVPTTVLHALLEADIEVCYLSNKGHFRGRLSPPLTRHATLRQEQHQVQLDPQRALTLARACMRGKMENMRGFLLRHNHARRNTDVVESLKAIGKLTQELPRAMSLERIASIDVNASAIYYKAFQRLLDTQRAFVSRRISPPTDPVGALLSCGNTLLLHQVTTAIHLAGLDPGIGFLHQSRRGSLALSLDLMEEFRPLIVDEVVLEVINGNILGEQDFQEEVGVVHLKSAGRKRFHRCLEERLHEEIDHPQFGYRASLRRCMEMQADLLGKWVIGEIPAYPPLCVV